MGGQVIQIREETDGARDVLQRVAMVVNPRVSGLEGGWGQEA